MVWVCESVSRASVCCSCCGALPLGLGMCSLVYGCQHTQCSSQRTQESLEKLRVSLESGELITHGFAFAPITAGERLRMLSVQILSVTCIFPVHFPTFPSASLASYYKIRRHLALVWFRPSCCVAPPALVNVRCWRGPETAGGRSGLCSPRSTSPLHGLEPGLPVSVF